MIRPHEIPIKPGLVRNAVQHNENMINLRKAVRKRFGASEQEATMLAERLLGNAVKRFGAKYLNEMAGHIELLFKLREQAAGVLERVLGAEELSPQDAGAQLEGIFRDIKSHMDEITDPEKFTKKKPIKMADDELSILSDEQEAEAARLKDKHEKGKARKGRKRGLPSGRHVEKIRAFKQSFKKLPEPQRAAVQQAARLAPRELWRAVTSEAGPERRAGSTPSQGNMLERNIEALKARAKAEGMDSTQVEALGDAAREMSEQRAKTQRLPGTAEAFRRAEAVKNLVSTLEKAFDDDSEFMNDTPIHALSRNARRKRLAELQAVVKGNRQLELLAAENPIELLQFFEASGAKSPTELWNHIRHNMITHYRGMLGEFTATFQLGDGGVMMLKVPDHAPMIAGTDMVGVTSGGRVWLIDNKAWTKAELDSVTSLMKMIRKNVSDDSEMAGKLGLGPDPAIGDAVARLDKARAEIEKLTNGMTEEAIDAPNVQQKIAGICNRNGISRVVTNAGGTVNGLSQGLRDAKIRLVNLNKRAAKGRKIR
jgi:hypothetical protein